MDIAIIDDWAEDRLLIRDMVLNYMEKHCLQADIFLFSSGAEFFKAYRQERFSIVLLDQYMDGMDGMAIAQKLRDSEDHCQLVFVTNSDTYAVQSYDVEASGYLLKPLDPALLERTLDRCVGRLRFVPKYLQVISNRLPTRVPLNSILWVNTYQNTILLHTDNGEIKTYMTFSRLARILEEDKRFLLCYKGCMVNMDRITSIEGNDFRLDSGDLVQIRKRGGSQIKQAYLQYLCDKALPPPPTEFPLTSQKPDCFP